MAHSFTGYIWMLVEDANAAGKIKTVSGIACAGVIIESFPRELLPQVPIIYIKAVCVEHSWEPASIGYLRPDVYNCPCYSTSFRGPTYVFLATLDTKDAALKWIIAGVALLLSSD